jgi:hypothetical protein
MKEFSPMESPPIPELETPETRSPDDNQLEARDSDWLFGFLIFLAILAFVLALIVGLLQTLSLVMPFVGWLQRAGSALDHSFLVPSFLPEGMPGGYFIALIFLALSALFFVAARQRVMHNPTMQSTAGCPSCHERVLVRVHRNRNDRLYSLAGIPFGRYQCRECTWNGLRIKQEERLPSYIKDYLVSVQTAAEAAGDADLAGQADDPGQDSENTTAVAGNNHATAGQTLASGDSLAKESNSRGFLAAIFSREAPPGEDILIENQEPVQDQEGANDSDWAKIVSPLSLNLRKDPQADGEVIGMLEPGTIVKLLDRSERVEGITWSQIRANDQDGWVLDSFLETHP